MGYVIYPELLSRKCASTVIIKRLNTSIIDNGFHALPVSRRKDFLEINMKRSVFLVFAAFLGGCTPDHIDLWDYMIPQKLLKAAVGFNGGGLPFVVKYDVTSDTMFWESGYIETINTYQIYKNINDKFIVENSFPKEGVSQKKRFIKINEPIDFDSDVLLTGIGIKFKSRYTDEIFDDCVKFESKTYHEIYCRGIGRVEFGGNDPKDVLMSYAGVSYQFTEGRVPKLGKIQQ
jgi:hypothetical protein